MSEARSPHVLKMPGLPREPEAKRVFDVEIPPMKESLRLVVECEGAAELIGRLRVRIVAGGDA